MQSAVALQTYVGYPAMRGWSSITASLCRPAPAPHLRAARTHMAHACIHTYAAGGDNGFNQAIELSADMLANVKFVQVCVCVCVCVRGLNHDTFKGVGPCVCVLWSVPCFIIVGHGPPHTARALPTRVPGGVTYRKKSLLCSVGCCLLLPGWPAYS